MSEDRTRDPVNQVVLEVRDRVGLARFGLMQNQAWHDDPRRLAFTLSRYKFVAKMLSGRGQVLEIGCGDGFCARVVKQEVAELVIVDFDPLFIEDARSHMDSAWPYEARVHDILRGPVEGRFDAAFTLDVLEHIPPALEGRFLRNLVDCLDDHGVAIVGTPSLESQAYASPPSRAGHVNCKTAPDLKRTLQQYFHDVFVFSMNDEIVHTGFHKMAHYLMALCCSPRR